MESGRWFGSPFLLTLHCADTTLREGAQCLERAPWAPPGQCQTLTEQQPTGEGALLSAGKKAAHGKKGSTAAEKYPNRLCEAGWECKKFRGAGLSSEMGR